MYLIITNYYENLGSAKPPKMLRTSILDNPSHEEKLSLGPIFDLYHSNLVVDRTRTGSGSVFSEFGGFGVRVWAK